MLKSALKVAITLFSVFYPFGILFFKEFVPVLLVIMAILWGLRGILEFLNSSKFGDRLKSEFGKFSFILCGFFALCAVFNAYGLKYLYPVLINAFLGVVFYISLKSVPMITKFAMIKDKNLPEKGQIYTRKITKIWIGFFIFNGLVSAVLACFENKFYWAIYCGAISYILIALLIFGEIIFRKIYIKNG